VVRSGKGAAICLAVSETLRIFVGVKRMPVFLLLVVLALIGCRQRTIDRTLGEANTVVEHNADSAYALLQQIPDAAQSDNDATRAFYALLANQAAYKLYKPVLPDSLMQAAVSYYRQTNNLPLLCRACYYRAMPLYEQGRHDQALQLLKEGEQIAAELNDLLQLSKYYESLCMVNDRSRNNDLMLKYATQFLDNAFQLGDTVLIARGYCHVSTANARMNRPEETREIILKTLPLLNSMDSIAKAYILTNIACTLHDEGDNKQAKYYLELSLGSHPRPNTYAELGMIYAEEGNDAEAMKCWQKALSSENPKIVVNTLNSIAKQYKRQHDYENALAIAERLSNLKDSIHDSSEQAKVAEIQHRYDRQVVENRLYKTLTWSLSGAVVVLIFLMIAVYYHRRVVKTFSNKLDESMQSLMETQRQIVLLESERQKQIEQQGKANEKYNRRIEALKKKAEGITREATERIGHGRDVYKAALKNNPIRLREDEDCLIEYFSVMHHKTYSLWVQNYSQLSSRLITFLILQDMGKTDADIEHILSIEYSSVRSIKSRLKAKESK